MSDKKKKSHDFYFIGIVLAFLFVVISIVWFTISSICTDDKTDDLTWVG